MFLVRAAMRGAVVLAFIAFVTYDSPCVGASLNNKQEDVITQVHLFNTENNTILIKWNLANPSNTVQGYRVTFGYGAFEHQAHESQTEASIAPLSPIDCHTELVVTITPLDEENKPAGKMSTKKFAYSDVITDITLTPEETKISASWTLECPSGDVYKTIVIYEARNGKEQKSCHFSGSASDTTERAKCDTELALESCKTYNVSIEPIDSSSKYIGIAGNTISYTLEEDSGFNLLEKIELEKSESRSATLLWKGPNPECPGTNYAVTYTETRLGDGLKHKGRAEVKNWSKWSDQNKGNLITANLHPTDEGKVMCHLDNLQPFSEYDLCVAAGNALVNLKCLNLQTGEEKPEKPRHLSLQNEQRSSTTIDVMWKEPSNMNGNFVNYIVRWYRDSKHVGSHNTTKLAYSIVDAELCVEYTITVAAVNRAGEGEETVTVGALEDDHCDERDYRTDVPETHQGNDGDKKESTTRSKDEPETKEGQTIWLYETLILATVVLVIVLTLLVIAVIFWRMKESAEGNRRDSTRSASSANNSVGSNDQSPQSPLMTK